MATWNGRDARISVSNSTTEAIVAEMANWSISRKTTEIDTTSFGSGWSATDVGMLSYSGSFSGSFDPTDTTGQGILKTAFEAGTLINDIRFYLYYSSTTSEVLQFLAPATGATNGIRITDMSVSIDKNGVGQLNVSFSGSGPIEESTETVS